MLCTAYTPRMMPAYLTPKESTTVICSRLVQMSPEEALRANLLMERSLQRPGVVPEGFVDIVAKAGHGMLVEPRQGAIYVFIPPNSARVWAVEDANPHHRMQQRLSAGLFLQGLELRSIETMEALEARGIEVRRVA